jgi:hypothetical protein
VHTGRALIGFNAAVFTIGHVSIKLNGRKLPVTEVRLQDWNGKSWPN